MAKLIVEFEIVDAEFENVRDYLTRTDTDSDNSISLVGGGSMSYLDAARRWFNESMRGYQRNARGMRPNRATYNTHPISSCRIVEVVDA